MHTSMSRHPLPTLSLGKMFENSDESLASAQDTQKAFTRRLLHEAGRAWRPTEG